MKLKRKTDSPESREYWEFADKMIKRVEEYPNWKKGGDSIRLTPNDDRCQNQNNGNESGQNYNIK